MKMKKRLLSILFSLALVLGLMPGMSLTAYAATVYETINPTTINTATQGTSTTLGANDAAIWNGEHFTIESFYYNHAYEGGLSTNGNAILVSSKNGETITKIVLHCVYTNEYSFNNVSDAHFNNPQPSARDNDNMTITFDNVNSTSFQFIGSENDRLHLMIIGFDVYYNTLFTLLNDSTIPVIKVTRGGTAVTEGAPQIGDVLTAETDATDLVYEWYRDTTTKIDSATGSTYTLTTADLSKAISVKVYQTKDADGNDVAEGNRLTQTSTATVAVEKKTAAELSADDAKNNGITFTYTGETISANNGYEVSSTNTGDGTAITSLTDILDGEGTPTIYVRTAATDDTAAGAWVEVTLTARPAAPTGLTTESATNGSTADGKIKGTTAAMEYSDDNGATWNNADATETAVKPGTYLVRAKATESAPHGIAATVTVGNREIVLSDKQKPTAKTDLVYTGSEQELVNKPVEGLPEGAREIQYALGTATEATQPYTTSIPTATNAGTYYVWYIVVGDEDHTDSEPSCVTVTIEEQKQNKDEAVANVIDLINKLPSPSEVTANDKEQIEAARAAYDALTDEQKSQISEETLKKLTDIEASLAEVLKNTGDTQQNPDGTKTVTKENTDGKTISVTNYSKTDEQISQFVFKKADGTKLDLKNVNSKSLKTVVVPATVKANGKTYKVTRIRKGFLKNCKQATKVDIGKNVNTIDKNAFNYGKKVKKVVIRGKLKKVGKGAFKNTKKNVNIKVQTNAKNFEKNKKLLEKSGLPKNATVKRVKNKK